MTTQALKKDSSVSDEQINKLDELRKMLKKMGKDYYKDPRVKRDVLPTGYLTLDEMLGGGIRSGTYVELFGQQGTGKTFLALQIMKQCQQVWNKPVMYVDFEKSWYPERAEELGLNLSEDMCDVIEPPYQEEGYDVIHAAVASNVYGVIVIDSMSAMAPFIETDKAMENENVAKNARVNSKAFRVITAAMKDTIIIFINQLRTNIGQMFGDPNTTTGGMSLGFYASMRLSIAKIAREKEEREVYSVKKGDYEKQKTSPGHIMKIRFEKSRVNSNVSKHCELVYDYDLGGVDIIEDQKAFLYKKGIIERQGAQWYTIKGHDKKIQGKAGLYNFLKDNQEFVQELIQGVKEE